MSAIDAASFSLIHHAGCSDRRDIAFHRQADFIDEI